MSLFGWFKPSRVRELENTNNFLRDENEKLESKNKQLQRDVYNLEKELDQLKKQCGLNKNGPAVLTSRSNRESSKSSSTSFDVPSNRSNVSKNTAVDESSMLDSAMDVVGDIAEGVGEVVGSMLD